jgi:hypothetical protein
MRRRKEEEMKSNNNDLSAKVPGQRYTPKEQKAILTGGYDSDDITVHTTNKPRKKRMIKMKMERAGGYAGYDDYEFDGMVGSMPFDATGGYNDNDDINAKGAGVSRCGDMNVGNDGVGGGLAQNDVGKTTVSLSSSNKRRVASSQDRKKNKSRAKKKERKEKKRRRRKRRKEEEMKSNTNDLSAKVPRKRCTPKEQKAILLEIKEGAKTQKEIIRSKGVTKSMVCRWKQKIGKL